MLSVSGRPNAPPFEGRKWYALPFSILVHALLIGVLVIIPLVATDRVPIFDRTPVYVPPADLPSPPPEPPPAGPKNPTPGPSGGDERGKAPVVPPDTPPGPEREPTPPGPPGVANQPEGPGGSGVPGPGFVPGSNLPEPPPPPPPPVPRVGGRISQPAKLKDVQPQYPAIAQTARVEGVVIIECTIGVDGRVTNAFVLRSIPLLDQSALDAVKQWEFKPTLLNGVPTPVIMTVTVLFKLQ